MQTIKHLLLWGVYALIAYMPFHVFLSQSISLLTGGLAVWKIAKDVFIICLAALSLFIVMRYKAWNRKYTLLIIFTAIYGLLHLLIYVGMGRTSLEVAGLATLYNVRLLVLLIIGISVGLLFNKSKLHHIFKLVLVVSSVVAALGIIQYFLPTDVLSSVGYSESRGAKPSFLIDNKADLQRVMSTIREPNSLGAYLVLPILLLCYMLTQRKRVILLSGLLGLHIMALLLTFSRSAWLALVISGGIFAVAQYGAVFRLFMKRHIVWVTAAVVLLGVGIFAMRDQYFIQNVIFHSDENTVSELDSNEKHLMSLDTGTDKVLDYPFGHGPGTAGPVSVHTEQPFITENYYLQLAYEIGIVGFIMFVAVCVTVFIFLKKINTPHAKVLYAVFVGYAVCNLFLHTWSNEAVATQWWLLAGVLIGVHLHSPKLRVSKVTSGTA